MSKIVDPKTRTAFTNLCLSLLNEQSFVEFEVTVKKIIRDFPDTKGWIKWYMRDTIAPHIFPACNSAVDDPQLRKRFILLSKDTNLQEGLGSSLKRFLGGNKNHPNELVQGIWRYCRLMSTQHRLAKQGKCC
jgi:hypothetical protein